MENAEKDWDGPPDVQGEREPMLPSNLITNRTMADGLAAALAPATKKRQKFNATKVREDGHLFDSKAEYNRYVVLKLRERAGEIRGLVVHPIFLLIDSGQRERALTGFLQQRPEMYEADFVYGEGRPGFPCAITVVEDVKGGRATQTPLWKSKWQRVRALFPQYEFRVVETTA